MAVIKTPNIGLNDWQGNERPKRIDFVEDNANIDKQFSPTEGHNHSGAAGQGPKIEYADLEGVPEAPSASSIEATIDQSQVATVDTGSIGNIFSWIANRIKAITGKADWKTAPAISLEAANIHTKDTIAHPAYAVAAGTNAYTVAISGITSLIEGMGVKIKFTNANTGACTLDISGLGAKSIIKSNGSALSSGNIKAGQVCHLVYTGVNFQLLGEGGEYGTAQAQHVLEGYSVGTEGGLINGSIPSKVAATITPSTIAQVINAGQYLSGIQTILGDADLISANIKAGANIFGVAGKSTVVDTYETTGIDGGQILSGFPAWSNGIRHVGAMVANGAFIRTLTLQGQSIAIPAGHHNGAGYIGAVFPNLSAGNVKKGVNIGGVIGEVAPADLSSASLPTDLSMNFYSIATNTWQYITSSARTITNKAVFIYTVRAGRTSTLACANPIFAQLRGGPVQWGTSVVADSIAYGSQEQHFVIVNPSRATITVTSTVYGTSGTNSQDAVAPIVG